MKARILIVDDEKKMAMMVAMALRRSGYTCEAVNSGADALEAFAQEGADVVVTDWKMPKMDGLALMQALHAQQPSLPVILMTAFADVPSAVAAMREGAFDYIAKPFDNDELRSLVRRALEMTRLQRENRYLRQEVASRYAIDNVIAQSPQSKELLALLQRVAPTRAAVLVQGESGTGKELVARMLHFWSERVGAPFVAVNCKAFAQGVLESELFGHEKGAFTGAVSARPGCFERADGGTLFLDEIGEVDLDFQGKLLRVLETEEVLRVGGSQPRKIDVRIVAATNRLLRDEVAAGNFREDLFFRLNVIPIQLTPLRERKEDILPLASLFLARHAEQFGRPLAFSPESEEQLLSHPWQGNVRELQNAIQRAAILTQTDTITPDDMLLEQGSLNPPTLAPNTNLHGSLQDAIEQATIARIRAALAETNGQKAQAAELLGVDRTTLYRLLKRHHL